MGWSNLSLILLESSCSNRPSFPNPLIHRPFAFTSQWANTAINHYNILNFLAVSVMAEAISLRSQSQHHVPSVLRSPLGTAKSPVPAQLTFTHLPCAPQGPGSRPTHHPTSDTYFLSVQKSFKDGQQGADVGAQGCWTLPPAQPCKLDEGATARTEVSLGTGSGSPATSTGQ